MGLGHVAIILFAISVSIISIPAYAASNIVILEVESNPAGTDAGNEWVKLFNPSASSVNLSGWEISSTHGNTNTHFLSEIIPACDDIKIIFPSQFIDNEDESLILYDNTGIVVDSTPIIYDTDNDATTWKIPAPSCESIQPEISLNTSQDTYEEGDTIVITGQVSSKIEDTPLTLQILHESNLVEIVQVVVAQDGSYSHTLKAAGDNWKKDGTYTIRANYGGKTIETTFEFFTKPSSSETTNIFEVDAGRFGTFDVEYTIRGGIVKNMVIDFKESALDVTIDSENDGTISIDLPRKSIDAKKSDGTDDTFLVKIDGREVRPEETSTSQTSRTLKIEFEEGDSDIKIIGTFVVGGDPSPNPNPNVWGELGTIFHRFDGPYDFIETKVTTNIIRGEVNIQHLLNGKLVREATTDTDHTGKIRFTRNITDDPFGLFEFRLLTTANHLLDRECFNWNGFDSPNNRAVDCDVPIPTPEPLPRNTISIPAGASIPDGLHFSPSTLAINVGDTVTWKNDDSAAHTVTSGSIDGGGPDGNFDSSLFMAGTTFKHTFNQAGEFEYFCMVHPWQYNGQGVIIVGDGSPPPPSTSNLNVSTDKTSYKSGEMIKISGEGAVRTQKIIINIFSNYGKEVVELTIRSTSAGAFSTIWIIPNGLDSGTYTIKINDSFNTATTSFRLVSDSPSPSFSVNVETDQSSYNRGDIIIISGKVNNPQDYDVAVRITNPRAVPVYQQNLGLKNDGTFSDMLIAGDRTSWIPGTFTVKATHNDKSDTSTFRFIDTTPTPTPSPSSVRVSIPTGTSVPGCEETNQCFLPTTVRVSQFGEVTWWNDDTAAHTVTSGTVDAGGPDGNFDSSLFMAGTTFSVSFDSEGTFPYFCMVHPWMSGTVIVGEGGPILPPPTPSPAIEISVSAEQAVYDLGDIVNLQVKISGTTSSQNVGVSVTDPTGTAVVSRTLSTDRNGNAAFDFGIHEDFKTGTYRVSVTSSIGGVTYKDTTHFKIQSQFNQIRIVSVEVTDQQGNPSSFNRGEMGFVKVVVNANKPIASLITVNLFDSELTTIGIGSFRTTLSTGESEMILSFLIPEDAATGAADIFTNAFSDWPSNGGVPLTGEFSVQVRIT